ncbi:alpha/beta fold hydrolase [Streptomyces turgidiscabies]|uniref:Pimeloyl-ACP methyl ester carboxylesterase n=1 Tax=Streptomyces turgidiscabies TaxID=85558 RepID=A0ABU0RTB9_9ACTN|nr:alpha/beta hydrolase [Streptomyces turgidiscabies]MDQ0935246.1 pimeloyl-ACP methyl ester carboxylesterase [Streptomyces turgidiscabies]
MTTQHTAEVLNGRLKLRFQAHGSGPDLIFFPSVGVPAQDPLVTALAQRHTVHVPEFPGTGPHASHDIHALDDWWDVLLAYEEALRQRGLAGAPAVGHGFGGMLAADLAANHPDLFSRLVLIGALGLWSDDDPPADWLAAPPQDLPGLLFADQENMPAAAPGPDPEAAVEAAVSAMWAMGCAAKFLWPLPECGLAKRLHRVCAPTLLLWGEQDRISPPIYAKQFAQHIDKAAVHVLPACGHLPQWEAPADTELLVRNFLNSGGK